MSHGIEISDVISAFNSVIYVQDDNQEFSILGPIPEWLKGFGTQPTDYLNLRKSIIFLDNFIDEAQHLFLNGEFTSLNTGPWSESDRYGNEHHFSATAMYVKQHLVLYLKKAENNQLHYQQIFQKARTYSLNYERLEKEIDKKNILLHTIVHDLATPLTAIKGALQIVTYLNSSTDETTKSQIPEMLAIALNESERQENLIKEILNAFSSEVAAFNVSDMDYENALDVMPNITYVFNAFAPAFTQQNIALNLKSSLSKSAVTKVIAEKSTLQRIIANLLENSLRYSPDGSTVDIVVSEDESNVLVSINDQGPGIPKELINHLFQKFSGGEEYGGKAGLGLYFCRISVEKWGGTIGAKNNKQGGSSFWFTLPKISASEQLSAGAIAAPASNHNE